MKMFQILVLALSISAMLPPTTPQQLDQIEAAGPLFAPITARTLDEIETVGIEDLCSDDLMDLSIDLTVFLARRRDVDLSTLSGAERALVERAISLLQKVETQLDLIGATKIS